MSGFDAKMNFGSPKAVLNVGVNICKLIGNRFYSVDFKQGDRIFYIIKVNDNSPVGSQYLGA